MGSLKSELFNTLKGLSQSSNADDLRIKQAIPGATATVIELGDTDYSRKFNSMTVRFRLEITPSSGDPYQIISVWDIQPVHANDVQVGKTIPVKVDAQNPKIIYPDVPWAIQPSAIEFDEDDLQN